MFQSFKFQVCLLVQKGPKFHNMMIPIISIVQQSETINIINIKDKVWQTVFVTDILQACLRQMSAISFEFVACEKVEKRLKPFCMQQRK